MLDYYNSDYTGIGASSPSATIPAQLGADNKQLFNGNISSMGVNIPKLGNSILYNYRYDQLNRIVSMDAWTSTDNAWNGLAKVNDYKETVSYDPNGNILSYLRNGTTAGSPPLAMDNLTYNYYAGANQLNNVNDAVGSSNYTEDIDNQSSGNYTYDAIGNLKTDNAEGITNISWTVYGKISSISKNGNAITYTYDASGNRITKTANGKTTIYVRDASGNVMSVYEKPAGQSLKQAELHLYGSSRLGITGELTVAAGTFNLSGGYGTAKISTFTRGEKLFELSNHLGNVLVTIGDKKIQHDGGNGLWDYYTADVANASDYYPFGMQMPERKYEPASGYRYGFNGKEKDKDISEGGQDYGLRISDNRLGRFLSVDPIAGEYPELTPYQFASNRPIDGIDQDGLEWSKSEPYFLSPVGKYVVDYKVILNIPQKSNWSVSKDGSYLNGLGKAISGILGKPNASGTTNDPIVNVNVSFKDDNNGSLKFSAVTSRITVNQNTGETPTVQTKWSDGTVFNEKVLAAGWTKTMGNVTENHVKLITYTGLMLSTNGKPDMNKPIDVVDMSSLNSKSFARTIAHELVIH